MLLELTPDAPAIRHEPPDDDGVASFDPPAAHGFDPATADLTFALITDPHWRPNLPVERTLGTIIQDINAMDPPADLVLFLGDCVVGSDERLYAQFMQLVAHLQPPAHLLTGNHEHARLAPDYLPWRKHVGPLYEAFRCKGYGFIGLHTGATGFDVPGEGPHEGDIDPDQFDWLCQQLNRFQSTPATFVYLHVPIELHFWQPTFYPQPVPVSLLPATRRRVLDLLERHNVRAAFAGHVHRNNYAHYQRLTLVTTASPATNSPDRHGLIAPPGYRRCYVAGPRLVTQYVEFP